jgi:hypothetical protein
VIAPPLAFDFEALDRTAANDVPNENGANLLRRTDQVTPVRRGCGNWSKGASPTRPYQQQPRW